MALDGGYDMLWWWKYRLRSKDPIVREEAASKLAQSNNPRVIPMLAPALRDPVARVRQRAIEGLWQWNDPQVVAPLVAALRDSDSLIRKMAVAGLREMGWKGQRPREQLSFALAAGDWSAFFAQIVDEQVAESVLDGLTEDRWLPAGAEQALREAAVAAGPPGMLLVKAAFRRERPSWCRELAFSALGLMDGPEPLELLAEAIQLANPSLRCRAAGALARLGDQAAAILAPRAVDDDAGVRQAVAKALGEIGGPLAAEVLAARISEPDTNVRTTVVHELGRVGGPRAIAALASRVNDEHDAVRIAVVEALGRIGGNRAVEILAPHMNEADVSVRQSVANVLGRIGGNRAVEILEASATDEDEAVRRIALAGLRANQGLVRDPTTRARFAVEKKAWDKVAQMGQAAIGPLQDYFDSGGDGPGAVEALTNIGGPEVPAMLVSLLTRRDFYWEARTALIRLRERAVDALFAGLDSNNDQTRSYSGQILGEIGDRRTLGRLIAAMADEEVLRRIDPDWKTSEEARQAIPTLAGLAAVKGGRNALEAGWRLVYIGRATQTAEPFIAALRCKEFDFNSECSPRGIAIGDMRGLRDAQAFGPLLDFIDDPAYAATILGFLTEILKCSAAEIASAILQKAASLPDVLHSVHVGDTYIPDTSTTGWTRSDYEDRPLDCSSLRKLACDELNRRKT